MDFIDIPLRTIRFHGPMIKVFGREFKYRAPTVPKAIDAMKICFQALNATCWRHTNAA